MAVELRLLGSFEVRCDGVVVLRGARLAAKAAAILKILALQRRRSIPRERLIDMLWPDSYGEAGASSLYKALHQLRTAFVSAGLPRNLVASARGVVSLDPDVQIDMSGFRRSASDALGMPSLESLERALSLYTGDLLEDEGPSDWLDPTREELRATARELRQMCGGVQLERRDPASAANTFREILADDRGSEEAHRGLMRALAALGRRDEALRQYHRCVDALRDELDAEPSPETMNLYQSIRRGGDAAVIADAGGGGRTQTETDDVIDELERSGDAAQRAHAWDVACARYREAIDRLTDSGDDLRQAKLWLKLADANTPIRITSDIPELCRRAVDLAQRAGSFELMARAIVRFQDATDTVPGDNAGHREALELITDALADAPSGDTPGKALLLAASGRPLAAALQPNDSRHVTGRASVAGKREPAIEQRLLEAVEMARRVGDRNVLGYALVRLRTYITSPDTLTERLELTRELVTVTTEPRRLRWAFEAHLFRQEDLLEIGDIDGARIEARAMRRLGESLQSDAVLAVAFSMQATHDIADGKLAEADRSLSSSLLLDQKVGVNSNAWNRHLIQLLTLRWHEGRIAEVEEDVRRNVDKDPDNPSMRLLLALIFAETDRLDEARSALHAAVELQPVGRIPKDHLWWLVMAAMTHVAVAVESIEIARELHGCLLPYSARNASTWSAVSFGSASLLVGLLAQLLGDARDAETQFEDALRFNIRTRQRVWVARTRYLLACMLLRRGRENVSARGREFARLALLDAEELGMQKLRRECEAIVRAQQVATDDARAPISPA